MLSVPQALGRLDCQLIREDERFRRLSQEERETIEEMISYGDHATLSYLWVLGAMSWYAPSTSAVVPTKIYWATTLLSRLANSSASWSACVCLSPRWRRPATTPRPTRSLGQPSALSTASLGRLLRTPVSRVGSSRTPFSSSRQL